MLEGMIQTPLLVRKDSDVELRMRRRASQGGRTASGWGPQLLCAGESTTRDSFSAGGGDDAGCVELVQNKNKPQ